jgi:hypothetical protein
MGLGLLARQTSQCQEAKAAGGGLEGMAPAQREVFVQ